MPFLKIPISFTPLIPSLLPPRDEREKTERTTAQLPANKKCCLLIFAIAIGCLVLAATPASYCPPPFCLSIVSNNIRVPLRSATRLAFASDLANILRSLLVTLEHLEHPSPSPVNARRCPVSRVPIPSRHLVKLSRFRPREFPHLYTILFTPSTKKIALKAIFICIYAKIIVSLHPQFHAGDVCASSAGVADIFKRRLLTLCSDALKLRNFHICIQDLATVDVLRDIDYPSCAYWCWYIFCVYVYAHTRTLTM